MLINELDDLIKKAMLEKDKGIEPVAQLAKESVWHAIEKPKRKRTISWGFVTAIAASLVLFLISCLLLNKLEEQKKELLALKATVGFEVEEAGISQLKAENIEVPKVKGKVRSDENIAEVKSHSKKTATPIIVPLANLENTVPEPFTASTLEIILEKPDITLPEFALKDLKPELNFVTEKQEEKPAAPKSKTPKKLKFQIGNNNKAYHSDNTLALNIKLLNN